ncbi:MAG: cupin, partial [Actinomyces sp.]
LWASAGLEVVEVTAPAVHPTHRDHDTVLPDTPAPPDRRWGGQLFVHHVAATAPTSPSWLPGFEAVDLGIATASGGRAGVRTHVATLTDSATSPVSHTADVVIFHVLAGAAEVVLGSRTAHLGDGDTLTVGPGTPVTWRPQPGLRLLEVALPEHGAAGPAPAP